ncbi:MAG: hypothetical protein GTO54_08535, partial [Nitrososphaeria archaeon]|nr:hypothetical protein [Nitrososphaeria archaeon]
GCSVGRFDVVVILSRHSGKGGERRLTVHVPGNPDVEARFGGEPFGLGLAAPSRVKAALQALIESVEHLELDGWHVSM